MLHMLVNEHIILPVFNRKDFLRQNDEGSQHRVDDYRKGIATSISSVFLPKFRALQAEVSACTVSPSKYPRSPTKAI